jgi:thiol:disulfide interchange protein
MRLASVLIISSIFVGCSYAQNGSAVSWSRDLEAAKKIAKKQKKLIFVDFFADWCGPCQQMDKEVFKTKRGSELLKDFVSVKQDVDREGKKNAIAYSVESMPTIFVLDPDGKTILRFSGGIPAETLERFLAEAKKRYKAKKR